MRPLHRLYYTFQQENNHIPPAQARPIAPHEWTGYLKRLRAHRDQLGFIDNHHRHLIISYEAFSGHYWCEMPRPEQQASYAACQNPHQTFYLLQSLPEHLIPAALPELQLTPWYPSFEDSPHGSEAQNLLQQSGENGELARAAEDICASAVKGEWDKLCDDHLALLQRRLLAQVHLYRPSDFQRLQNGLQWIDEIVEHNEAFDENCMNDLCDMLLMRIVDLHNHQQPRH